MSAQQIGRRGDRDAARPGRLGPLRTRTDQPALGLGRVQRGEQHAGRGLDARIEAELADRDIFGQGLGIEHPHRDQHAERDRQIEMRALLGQIGGRQVDGDPLGRQRQPDRAERRAHPLAALAHRLVGQADQDEGGQPRSQLHLYLDRPRLEPEKGDGRDDRDQAVSPHPEPDDRPATRSGRVK